MGNCVAKTRRCVWKDTKNLILIDGSESLLTSKENDVLEIAAGAVFFFVSEQFSSARTSVRDLSQDKLFSEGLWGWGWDSFKDPHSSHLIMRKDIGNLWTCCRGSFAPFGPKVGKRVQKVSSRGLKKVENGVEKDSNLLFFNYFDSFSTPFSTFWVPGPRGSRNSFSDSFSHFGPEGPK